MMIRTTLFAFALALVPMAAAAQDGASEDAFQAQVDAALAHYEARRYDEAAAAFQAAFELRAEPELLYNIARSYERALRREEAVTAYDRFLEQPGTTSEMRSRALTARNSLRAEITAMSEPEPAADPPGTVADPEASSERAAPPSESSSGGRTDLSPIGWVLVGVGVAAVGVGAVFGGLALASNDSFNATTDREEQVRLQSEVRRYALLTDILIGTGAGVVIAGVVFLVVDLASRGSDDERAAGGLDLQPFAGLDVVGLSLSGTF